MVRCARQEKSGATSAVREGPYGVPANTTPAIGNDGAGRRVGVFYTPQSFAVEARLETTSVRLLKFPGICIAPQYVSDELLRSEGFTEIEYVDAGPTVELSSRVGQGEADFTLEFAARTIQTLDRGGAITVLGGVHVGCYVVMSYSRNRRSEV